MTRLMAAPPREGSGAGGAAAATAAVTGAGRALPAEMVGRAFVTQYFRVLQVHADLIYKFYTEESKVTRTEGGVRQTVTTQEGIRQKVMSKEVKAEIKSIDAQDSLLNSILVMVTGYIPSRDPSAGTKREFSQSFVLAPQEGGYYVLNDIFCYMDEEDEQVEGSGAGAVVASEEVEKSPVAPAEVAPMANGIHEEEAAPHEAGATVAPSPFEPSPTHGTVQLNEVEPEANTSEEEQQVLDLVPSSFPPPTDPSTEENAAGTTEGSQEVAKGFEAEDAPASAELHPYEAPPAAPAPPSAPSSSSGAEGGSALLSVPAVSAGEANAVLVAEAGGASAETGAAAGVVVAEASAEPEKPKKFSYASAVLKPRAAAPPPAPSPNPPRAGNDGSRSAPPSSARLSAANGTQGSLSPAPSGDFSEKSSEEAGGAAAQEAEGRRRVSGGQAQAPLPAGGAAGGQEQAEGAAGGAAPSVAASEQTEANDGRSIYVRNLPPNTLDKDLAELFTQFGKVVNANVRSGRVTNYTPGGRTDLVFGFVDFEEVASAQAAIEKGSIMLQTSLIRIERKGGGRNTRGGGGGGMGPRTDRGGPFRPRDNRGGRGMGSGGYGGGRSSGRGGPDGNRDSQQAGLGGGSGGTAYRSGGGGGRGPYPYSGGNGSGPVANRAGGAASPAAPPGAGAASSSAQVGAAAGANVRGGPRRVGGQAGGGAKYSGGGQGPGGGGSAWGAPAAPPAAAVSAE